MFALALAACGDKDPNAAPGQAPAKSTDPAPTATAENAEAATRGMVAGVSAGKAADAAVDLKFELRSRPEIGQPLTIGVALIPHVETPSMRATFISTEGLSVRTSEVPAEYRDVQPGSVYRHELTVVPRENGVYYVSAVVMMQMDSGELNRTFSIPVMVGAAPESETGADQPQN